MAFDDTKQYSVDVNGNFQYVDPMYYLFNYSDNGYQNIQGIFSSYISEQKKIEALINEKYGKARESEPQHVGGMVPPWFRSGYTGPVPPRMIEEEDINNFSPVRVPMAHGPQQRQPTLRNFSFRTKK